MESVIFQTLSLLLLGLAAFLVKRKFDFIAECDQTTGTVVAFRERKRSGKNTTYAPVVEYSALGKTLRHQSDLYKAWRRPAVGSSIGIFYKREKPEDALIDSFMEKWFVVLILSLIGSLFFVIGFGPVIGRFFS